MRGRNQRRSNKMYKGITRAEWRDCEILLLLLPQRKHSLSFSQQVENGELPFSGFTSTSPHKILWETGSRNLDNIKLLLEIWTIHICFKKLKMPRSNSANKILLSLESSRNLIQHWESAWNGIFTWMVYTYFRIKSSGERCETQSFQAGWVSETLADIKLF